MSNAGIHICIPLMGKCLFGSFHRQCMWMPAFMLNPVPSSFSTDQVPAFVNSKKEPSVPITVYKLTGSSIQQKREQLKMYKFKNNLFKLSSNSEKLQSL